jgi:hypothetical protein
MKLWFEGGNVNAHDTSPASTRLAGKARGAGGAIDSFDKWSCSEPAAERQCRQQFHPRM